ncbi:MAG: enoyl-CoA hydratase/isomerase family protein [Myxococcota bacterium]|nr:enoyl-CoA hydratase/isomerase family protein [Myxococcota bacterium]
MAEDLILEETANHITTLTMNQPKRLNGWTAPMMEALLDALKKQNEAPQTHAVVLTGTGKYYSAGVNLSGAMRLSHPKKLRDDIIKNNQALFDAFLDFDKPIIVAVNGPAIGAPVTSATLCDAIVASEQATFSTPFSRLGITPEGCSSIHFAKIMSEEHAHRMLGPEGWKPTAAEALSAGLINRVAPKEHLLSEAQKVAAECVAKGRTFRGGSTREELKAANARESVQLANAFLSAAFLKGQMKFLWSKKKRAPAATFAGLWLSSPLWKLLL